ncbi:MAG: hypothetical protein ACE5HT_05140 [Gemmatimonadales bacterium]
MRRTLARLLWIGIGFGLIVLPVLPIARWVGAPDQGPVWQPQVEAWSIGLIVVLVGGVIAGRLFEEIRLPRVDLPQIPPPLWAALLALGFTALSAYAVLDAFSRNPQLIDEIAQLLQARVFAAGRLAAPAPRPPEFFLIAQTLITEAGWVSQYPPGEVLLLAAGMVVHLEWLINPVLGGISVFLVFLLGRGLYGTRTGLVGAFLFASSSWTIFMSATYMNHVGSVAFALVAWVLVFASRTLRPKQVVMAGFFLACVAATRPLDAVAATVPIVVWFATSRRIHVALWLGLGALPVAFALGYVNWRVFGSALTIGYTALQGSETGLGFHIDPWGRFYSPLIGLGNMASAVRRLHIYFYEWPIPALLPLALWAILSRQSTRRSLIVATGIVAGPLLYFFYWHSGFYPGPRFYYIAAPFVALAMAHGCRWTWLRARTVRGPVTIRTALLGAATIVMFWGWVSLVPARWHTYRSQLAVLKRHPERELARLGVKRALVIVPESWSSRIVTELWGLGAPPALVERVFRHADSCELYRFARAVRGRQLSTAELASDLEKLVVRSGALPRPRPDWPDPALRLRPGPIAPDCQLEMKRDLNGFTLYGQLAWRNRVGLDSGIVFARDLYELNHELFARYSGWPVWRYAPPRESPNSMPVLTKIADSAEGSAAVVNQ